MSYALNSGVRLQTLRYYIYALNTRTLLLRVRMRLLRVHAQARVLRIQGPAKPKHYRTAMLPTAVIYCRL